MQVKVALKLQLHPSSCWSSLVPLPVRSLRHSVELQLRIALAVGLCHAMPRSQRTAHDLCPAMPIRVARRIDSHAVVPGIDLI